MSETRTLPQWLRHTGVRCIEMTEPPLVQRYVGGQAVSVEADYRQNVSAEHLARLKADGAELISLRFFAGFGHDFEAAEMERARDVIQTAKGLGLRTGARLSLGWAVPETLIEEDPESPNWMQLTHDGKFVWGPHGYQCRPCYNSEGWLRCVEKAAAQAVDAGADVIFFDHGGYSPGVRACHCPLCVVGFRDFLRAGYGTQTDAAKQRGLDRFGHNSFIHARPPVESLDHRLTSPHQQEWLLYKIKTLTDALARLSRSVKRRAPNCAVGAELFDTFFASNSEYLFGIDPARWLDLLDVAMMREPRQAFPSEWTEDDRAQRGLNVRIAAKVARSHGAILIDYLQPPPASDAGPARLAVFHDTPSSTFNSSTSDSRHESELMLLSNGVPFEILHAGNLQRLGEFPCLIVPNCECLGDELAARFLAYLENGGGLILTEQTGRCDTWRRLRQRNLFPQIAQLEQASAPLHKESGKGRLVYLPVIRDRWSELENAVKWLMREEDPAGV